MARERDRERKKTKLRWKRRAKYKLFNVFTAIRIRVVYLFLILNALVCL